jgi:hypothetical protein
VLLLKFTKIHIFADAPYELDHSFATNDRVWTHTNLFHALTLCWFV